MVRDLIKTLSFLGGIYLGVVTLPQTIATYIYRGNGNSQEQIEQEIDKNSSFGKIIFFNPNKPARNLANIVYDSFSKKE